MVELMDQDAQSLSASLHPKVGMLGEQGHRAELELRIKN